MLRIHTISKVILLTLILTLLPSSLAASQEDILLSRVCFKAQAEARKRTNKTFWFAYGLIFGVVGLFTANIEPVTPPSAVELAGKPPEYVETYLQCYEEKVLEIRSNSTLYGATINGVVIGCMSYLYVIAVLRSLSFDFYYPIDYSP